MDYPAVLVSNSQNTSSTYSSETLEQIWMETQFIHSFSEGPQLRAVQTRKKNTRAPCRRSPQSREDGTPEATTFGHTITADHRVLNEENEHHRLHHRYAEVVQDLASQWIQTDSCGNKTAQDTTNSLQRCLLPESKP